MKFEDEHALFAVLRAAIKHSLGQFSIAPVLDFSKDNALETPYAQHNASPVAPRVSVNPNFNPFAQASKFHQPKKSVSFDDIPSNKVDEKLITNTTKSIVFSFQYAQKYIIAPHQNGVLMAHQRRAHERVLYEDYIRSWEAKEVMSQSLAVPLAITLDVPSISALKIHQKVLVDMGFTIDDADEDTIEFSAIPDVFAVEDIPHFLAQWLTQTANGTGYGYDARALPRRNVLVTSSFTGWNNYMMNLGKMMGDAEAMKRFGNTVVIWDLHTRKPKKVLGYVSDHRPVLVDLEICD